LQESENATGQSIMGEGDSEEERKDLFKMSVINYSSDRLLELKSSFGNSKSSVSSLKFEINEAWMGVGYTNGMI